MTAERRELMPKAQKGLKDRIEWINKVTELAAAENWRAVWEAIDEIDPENLRLLVHILIVARAGDQRKLQTLDAGAERVLLN
jgi:hypothetical protein